MLSSSISSKPRHLVSRRHRPQNVPPPSEEPLTRANCPSPVTFIMLTPLPMLTSKYGNRSESAVQDTNLLRYLLSLIM